MGLFALMLIVAVGLIFLEPRSGDPGEAQSGSELEKIRSVTYFLVALGTIVLLGIGIRRAECGSTHSSVC